MDLLHWCARHAWSVPWWHFKMLWISLTCKQKRRSTVKLLRDKNTFTRWANDSPARGPNFGPTRVQQPADRGLNSSRGPRWRQLRVISDPRGQKMSCKAPMVVWSLTSHLRCCNHKLYLNIKFIQTLGYNYTIFIPGIQRSSGLRRSGTFSAGVPFWFLQHNRNHKWKIWSNASPAVHRNATVWDN